MVRGVTAAGSCFEAESIPHDEIAAVVFDQTVEAQCAGSRRDSNAANPEDLG